MSLVLICNWDLKLGIIEVTHFSANPISLFYNQKHYFCPISHFIWDPWFTGGRAPLCFIPLSSEEGEILMLLLKKTIISLNERKKTGTWQHASCCSFNLVWWLCYFISTRKYLLLGKVEFCVVMTVNIHIWKVKWKKKI